MTKVDVTQHLPLISRVIGQMHLKADERDDAFSEGFLALVKASSTYDPSRNIPLANWLAKNIRWGILNWRHKQGSFLYLTIPIEAPRNTLEDKLSLSEAITKVEQLLNPTERYVVLQSAVGYKGTEIAEQLKISTVQVSRIKHAAQGKLRAALK